MPHVNLRDMPQHEIERRRARAYQGRILVGMYAKRSEIVAELKALFSEGRSDGDDFYPALVQQLRADLATIDAMIRRAES